jgi:hypothetical protein
MSAGRNISKASAILCSLQFKCPKEIEDMSYTEQTARCKFSQYLSKAL